MADFASRELLFGLNTYESYLDLSAQDLEFGFNETRRDRILRTYVRNVYFYHLNEIYSALKVSIGTAPYPNIVIDRMVADVVSASESITLLFQPNSLPVFTEWIHRLGEAATKSDGIKRCRARTIKRRPYGGTSS